MKWNNASIDQPPQAGQQVIICVNGIYYLAVYDAEALVYKLSGNSATVFDPRTALIYWM